MITNEMGRAPMGVEMIHTPLRFRHLTKDEIDCRVQSTTNYGGKTKVRLLLYKDARVDMNILDETVGSAHWQREHKEIKGNLYCGVGIQQDSGEWVWKWDCGAESSTEKEKGESSDSFKRACFAWGIGRELYTAPSISIDLTDNDMFNGKVCQSFTVSDIEINSKHEITYLSISDKWGKIRFESGKKKPNLTAKQKASVVQRLARGEDIWEKVLESFSVSEEELRKEVEKAKSGT